MATSRQTWALFCGTKVDCRAINLSVDEASKLISAMKDGDVDGVRNRLLQMGGESKGKPSNGGNDWQAVYDEAHKAGLVALKAAIPTPMVVGTPSTPLGNDIDETKPMYFVEGGVCGFAWVTVRPGNCSFAVWCRKNGIGHKAYYGGWELWVSEGGQSMERKEEYARAFAKVLTKHGIKAYSGSRMD